MFGFIFTSVEDIRMFRDPGSRKETPKGKGTSSHVRDDHLDGVIKPAVNSKDHEVSLG